MLPRPKIVPVPLSVSALVGKLRDMVEDEYPSVWVVGELTGLKKHTSGHWYFCLKDAGAQLRAAMFRGSNLRIKFDPKNGMEVIARGRVSVYGPKGDLQIIVEELQPKGIGAAELALRQLKERLFVQGYFDPKRKRALPRFPMRIGIVTSVSGAAIRDLIELFAQRWPIAELIVRAARVQGDGAGAEIAAAIRFLNQVHTTRNVALDAIVIARGGGSSEDLWAFNEEVVARAVFDSVVPVVSAVGHEIDVTIADLVADHRAETPSAAVTALTPDRRELIGALSDMRTRLAEAIEHRMKLARQQVEHLAARPALRRPLQRVRDLEQRLDDTAARLHRAGGKRVIQVREKLEAIAARLESLSPLNVLTRGYSLTHTDDGKLIRAASDVRVGEKLITRLAAGEIVSRVETTRPPG
jgi:exodeoxyribonuclease VII large subunit